MIKEEIEKVLAGEVHSYTSPSGVIIEAYRDTRYPNSFLIRVDGIIFYNKVDGMILYDKVDINFIINNYLQSDIREEKLNKILNND